MKARQTVRSAKRRWRPDPAQAIADMRPASNTRLCFSGKHNGNSRFPPKIGPFAPIATLAEAAVPPNGEVPELTSSALL
jgi:hypothetical protein